MKSVLQWILPSISRPVCVVSEMIQLLFSNRSRRRVG